MHMVNVRVGELRGALEVGRVEAAHFAVATHVGAVPPVQAEQLV